MKIIDAIEAYFNLRNFPNSLVLLPLMLEQEGIHFGL